MKALQLAWANVLRNRRRALGTILIAAVGCAALLIAGGFALYTYESLQEAAARESGHLILAQREYFQRDEERPLQYGLAGAPALMASLNADPEVRRVLPRLQFSGLISNGDKTLIFLGQGIDALGEFAERGIFLQLEQGQLFRGDEAGPPRVLLGRDLARSLGAKVGSGLTLIGTTTDDTMNALDVEVGGIVSTGVPEVDKRLVHAPLAAVQQLLRTDKVSTLALYLNGLEQVPARLARFRAEDPEHAYRPWWEEAFYYEAVRALYNRIFGLLGLIIAALVFFAVSNTLSMAVVERTREIGTQRALGATPAEIVRQFVGEGLVMGGCGVLLGMGLALATAWAFWFFEPQMPPPPGRSVGYPLQIALSAPLYAGVAVLLLALCGAAAWLSSRRAAARPIIEALGHV